MKTLKAVGVCICIGIVLFSLLACSEDFYLEPAKYVGTWTLENGTTLEKLILTEDTWIYVKGDELLAFFCYYQGGRGTFDITKTAINLNLDAIYACPYTDTCDWYAKGSTEYNDRAFFEQESVPYTITDTTLTLDLGSGPQEFTRP